MTRGDQRDRDRAKNLAKLAAAGTKKSGNPQQRREADAKALADKIAAKALAAEQAAADPKNKVGVAAKTGAVPAKK
ncbi:uncharacterized protein MKK02DRAFT_41101 [Dioszegia hungarica]|uniref:Small EDRK-rich factor-like N-terminal domain-containing protein n=1 Tax=Dioszegia hungarica TaxID=4972 RepID=A0AA38LSN5_9TREE|nr:uncharacterized protein MKK02DRAFT_41101 [Dioszegia hungarica]KAI9632789.1 hypothetical protein MKK02DRAFT_41101 [Dioszegia hungarica]